MFGSAHGKSVVNRAGRHIEIYLRGIFISGAVCLLVAEGAGISIVDPYVAIALEGRGLVIRRFSVTLDTGILCVRSERQPASLLATSFASEFEAHSRQRARMLAVGGDFKEPG